MPAYSAADIKMLLWVCRRELGTVDALDGTWIDSDQWLGMLAAALDHGLIGPLQSAASKTPVVPPAILGSLRTASFAQAVRNLQLTDALLKILRSFREYTIEVVVLKGPALALIAFDQIATREFTDLDLLVRQEDLSRARLVLGNLGYRRASEGLRNPRAEKDVQLMRDSDEVLVELHWALNPPNSRFPLEVTGIWNRLQTVYLQNEPIRTLGLEDTLLALCIHGSKHGWTSLKWAFDIAQILKKKSATLDWSGLSKRCKSAGCTRTLLASVRLASVLFHVKVAEVLTKQMSEHSSVMRLVERIRVSLVENQPLSRRDLVAWHVQIHDRLWDRFFVAVTGHVPDLPRLLPAAASPITSGPLRFITRPVRLLRLYGFDWLRAVIMGR